MYIRDILSFRISESCVRFYKPITYWIFGFILGFLVAGCAEPYIFSMVLRSVKAPMSIDGLLTVYLLPFLISAVALRLKNNAVLLSACFAKAFTYAYILSCFVKSAAFAWLLFPLYFFSDLYVGFILLWFSVFGKDYRMRSVFYLLLITAAVAFLDFFVISPFLAAIVI